MALVQTPEMTEKNLSAHRQNGRKSRGAATAEGKERARAANLRHGYYSKINDEALTALGEDPHALADLIAGAHQQWRPANTHQAWITERLARLQWKIDRSDRMQESVMAGPIQRLERRRREKALNSHYCYNDVHGLLHTLVGDTLRPDYYTPPGYFTNYSRAFRVNTGPRMEEILRLLHRLRQPQGYQPFTGRLPAGSTDHSSWKEVRELYEDGTAIPQPAIPIAQGEERKALRAELHALASEELAEVKVFWEETLLPEADQVLTQQERDELAANTYKESELMRRQEHSCLREFIRLGTFLVKLQARESSDERTKPGNKRGEMQQPESDSEERAPNPDAGPQTEPAAAVEAAGAARGATASNPNPGGESTSSTATSKNAGASGDVDENEEEANRPEPHFTASEAAGMAETPGGPSTVGVQHASV